MSDDEQAEMERLRAEMRGVSRAIGPWRRMHCPDATLADAARMIVDAAQERLDLANAADRIDRELRGVVEAIERARGAMRPR